jgi:membrane protein
VPDLAAEIAFYGILSLFPAMLAVASLVGVLDAVAGADLAADARREVVGFLETVLTDEADETIDAVSELFTEASPGLLTFSLLAALWALSRGFASLIRALDVVYDVDELRPWTRIRGTALLLSIGSVLSGAVLLAGVVVGPLLGTGQDIADEIGLGDQFAVAWDVARLPVAFVLVVVWATTIFHVAPDHRTRWRDDVPGAVVTGVLWLVFSGGLRVYLAVAQRGNPVFGTLGGALIALLWIWLLALAVMIGGEVNQIRAAARSAPVEGVAQGPHEVAGLDRTGPVEQQAHDRRGDDDAVGGGGGGDGRLGRGDPEAHDDR